jgi:hypothetical protein
MRVKNRIKLYRYEEGRLRRCGQLASPVFGEKGVTGERIMRYLFSRLYQENNRYNLASTAKINLLKD